MRSVALFAVLGLLLLAMPVHAAAAEKPPEPCVPCIDVVHSMTPSGETFCMNNRTLGVIYRTVVCGTAGCERYNATDEQVCEWGCDIGSGVCHDPPEAHVLESTMVVSGFFVVVMLGFYLIRRVIQ